MRLEENQTVHIPSCNHFAAEDLGGSESIA
jgi:hypothetical protein